MKACIFLGPTLAPREAKTILEATYLPPAAQGDVYQAAKARPAAIGIIDGLFQHVPSVWHKEILWAIAQGIRVFGSASMGALRAAELQTFGMTGVGKIFEAYRDGELTDDDEVAVLHGPPELDYIPLSEAMVNIRATLRAAERERIITTGTREQLELIAKQLFYQDRTYTAMFERAKALNLDIAEVHRLRDSLPAIAVNQKANDARALLQAIHAFLCQEPARAIPQYALENTRTWVPTEEDTETWAQSIS